MPQNAKNIVYQVMLPSKNTIACQALRGGQPGLLDKYVHTHTHIHTRTHTPVKLSKLSIKISTHAVQGMLNNTLLI